MCMLKLSNGLYQDKRNGRAGQPSSRSGDRAEQYLPISVGYLRARQESLSRVSPDKRIEDGVH